MYGELDPAEAERQAMTHAPAPPAPNMNTTFANLVPAMAPIPRAAPPSPLASAVTFVPPPVQPFVRERGSTTVTREKATKEEGEAAKRLRASDTAVQEAAKSQSDVEVQRASLEEKEAKARATRELVRQERQQKVIESADRKIADADSTLAAERERYGKMEIRDYWADKTTGAKVMGAIAVALGSIGQSLTGAPNTALRLIEGAIDRDFQRQRLAIEKQRDAINLATDARNQARQGKQDELASLELKQAAAERAAGAQAEAMAAQLKKPDALAKAQAIKAQLDQKAAERELRYQETLRAKVTNTTIREEVEGGMGGAGNKPLTESQAKAADLAGRMMQDNETINATGPMSAEGLKRIRDFAAVEIGMANNPKAKAALIISGKIKPIEQLLNDKDRLAYAARKRYAAAVLRGDSGAAISASEYLDFDSQNFEQLGDKEADMAAKRQSREQMIRGKMVAAGPAAAGVVQSVKPPPTAPAQGGQVEERTLKDGTKVKVRKLPDGRYEEVQ